MRWTNIFRYSFGHPSFTEYIRIFVRHNLSLTNIFRYSFGQKKNIRYTPPYITVQQLVLADWLLFAKLSQAQAESKASASAEISFIFDFNSE